MSAVDAPPGIAFAGRAAGELSARRRPRRLAKVVFYYVAIACGLLITDTMRHWDSYGASPLLALPIGFGGVALMGYLVRLARLRVDRDGIRWGWEATGFRMNRDRIAGVTLYDDAAAIEPKKGSTWFVSARDWADWESIAQAMRDSNIDFERSRKRAPFAARLQSYGLALDVLLILDAVGVTAALVAAAILFH